MVVVLEIVVSAQLLEVCSQAAPAKGIFMQAKRVRGPRRITKYTSVAVALLLLATTTKEWRVQTTGGCTLLHH